jgi:uncharacterized protein (DUF2147 family)
MVRTAILAAAFAALAGGALASPATGLWKTPEDGGQVEMYDCGDKLCGRIAAAPELVAHPDKTDERNRDPALRTRPLRGLEVVTGFSGGPSAWNGGKLYRPEDGRSYSGRIEMINSATLKVTGCLMPGLCQSQIWSRIR